jgi:Protein of unknown function (DUF4236)
MGWNIRRSFSLGSLRINLSKKGVGASVGVRGFRVGQDAGGRNYSQVSIPGTGIYRRDYYRTNLLGQQPGSAPVQVNQPAPITQQPIPQPRTISPSAKYLLVLVSLAALVWTLMHLILK